MHTLCLKAVSWWFGSGGTPGLIPNPEVKPVSTDDTHFVGKVGHRQDSVLKQP